MCVCDPGYVTLPGATSACSCAVNATCPVDPANGLVCSGRGTCECGQCQCPAGYDGADCSNCLTCVATRNLCESARDCSQCRALPECQFCNVGEVCQPAGDPCPDVATRCKTKAAPLIPAAAVTYGGLALGLLLLLFFVLLVLAKALLWWRNRKMFQQWMKNNQRNLESAMTNPLFKDANVEFSNPLYAAAADGNLDSNPASMNASGHLF